MDQHADPTRSLLIVWWSATGAARDLAASACDGALSEAGVNTRLMRCDQADSKDVVRADALMFVFPEMLGGMAGRMKDLFDRTYYQAIDQMAGRPYCAIITAGSDGAGAARQIAQIATGWRLREAAPPLVVLTHAQTPEQILAAKTVDPSELARARDLGAMLAAGLAVGVW